MKRLLRVLAAVLVVLSLAATPVAAASCNGKSHQPSLADGRASPASAAFGTPITFSVRYADTAGCVPSVVAVTIDGVGTFTMSTADTDLVAGVTYSWVTTLPIGSYGYEFSATSGQGAGQKTVGLDVVNPTRAIVTPPPPPPTPAPTPVPTPRPTPPPTPAPTAPPPAPSIAPRGAAPPAAPAAPRGADGSPAETAAASSSPGASATGSQTPLPTDDAPGSPSAEPSAGAVGAPIGGGGTSGGSQDGAAEGGSAPSPATGDEPDGPPVGLGLGAALVAAFSVMLWLVAGRRRRREAPDGVQPGATATMLTDTAGDEPPMVTPLPPMRELVPPPVNLVTLDEGSDRVEPKPDEIDMPRWLRPSLRQARQGPEAFRRWDD
jgi:hypothetical protein